MPQLLNDVNAVSAPAAAKAVWATPTIESYDVAEFTLAVAGDNGTDNGANIS